MMKPTSNAVLMNGKQGAADQRRSWRGVRGGGGGEGVIDCTASVCCYEARQGRVHPAGTSLRLVPPREHVN